jgi:citrate synthase
MLTFNATGKWIDNYDTKFLQKQNITLFLASNDSMLNDESLSKSLENINLVEKNNDLSDYRTLSYSQMQCLHTTGKLLKSYAPLVDLNENFAHFLRTQGFDSGGISLIESLIDTSPDLLSNKNNINDISPLRHNNHSNISYLQMRIYGAIGKWIDIKIAHWLQGNFIGLSYPDSRIWCNQIGAFSGICGTSVAVATLAGTLAADSRAYGGQTNKSCIEFLQQPMAFFSQAMSFLKDATAYLHTESKDINVNIAKHKHNIMAKIVNAHLDRNNRPSISGFARPVMRVDERIPVYEELRRELNISIGKHLAFAYQLDAYLKEEYGMGMNSGGYASALLADQGISSDEAYHIKSLVVANGVMACAIEYEKKGPNSFLPLHCSDIEYTGQ